MLEWSTHSSACSGILWPSAPNFQFPMYQLYLSASVKTTTVCKTQRYSPEFKWVTNHTTKIKCLLYSP